MMSTHILYFMSHNVNKIERFTCMIWWPTGSTICVFGQHLPMVRPKWILSFESEDDPKCTGLKYLWRESV